MFMDVEDPINPLADDAALDFALLFSRAGVKGSFCLTGEKCRSLASRRRQDVVEAMLPHCLGLHTDTHSCHPTTMELLEGLSFEEGCLAAFESEKRGYDAFVDLFGARPAFWGGAGNTWSPEITDALKRLEIPAYSYALTSLPEDAVHRFNGVMALPQALSISEASWMNHSTAQAECDRVLADLRGAPNPWTGVFVGHPTRFRHAEFWDKVYAGGVNPERLESAMVAPEQDFQRGKANLSKFLERLQSECEVIGVDEALSLPWSFRAPESWERSWFESHTSENLAAATSWPIHRPGLDARNIVEKTLALSGTLEVAELSTGP